MKVYDENITLHIIRDGEEQCVRFCDVQQDDILADTGAVVSDNAHVSEDPDYSGWLFFDTNGESYFPEDFGAEER